MKKKNGTRKPNALQRGGIFLLCFLLCFVPISPFPSLSGPGKKAPLFSPAQVWAEREGAEIQDLSLDDFKGKASAEGQTDQEDQEKSAQPAGQLDQKAEEKTVKPTEPDKEAEKQTADSLKKFFTYYDQVPIMLIGTVESPDVIMGKNVDQPHGIASMTKLMTYYLAKEDIRSGKASLEEEVKVSQAAADLNKAGYSNYGLKAGDTMPLSQLIYGMMTVSGNDAATVIAEHLGGSEKAFVERMNKTCQDMGLSTMHFVNASGITREDGQYNQSSARDLYQFALKLIKKYPEIQDFIQVKQVEEKDRKFSHPSTFFQYMKGIPGMKGLKTGNSNEAGHCFAGWFDIHSKVTKSNYEIIAILMGAPTNDARWRTTLEMVHTAAGSFAQLKLVDQKKPVQKYELPGSREGTVDLYPAESFSTFTYTNAKFNIHYQFDPGIKAPTKAGQKFGTISIRRDGNLIKEISIVSEKPTTEAPLLTRLSQGISRFTNFLSSLA